MVTLVRPSVAIIEELASSVTAIVIPVEAFISSVVAIIVRAAGSMAASADVSFSAVSSTEGHHGRPSVHRSRTLAAVSMAVAIIRASHRVIVVEVPEAFDDVIAAGAVEAASTLAGLE